jgi:hypothetical protein
VVVKAPETPSKKDNSSNIVIMTSPKDSSDLMEDKAMSKNIKAQMDFLGTRKIADEEEKKKNKKTKKRGSKS